MAANDYTTVTELPGNGASREQLSMMQTRYKLARELSEDKDVLELACGPGIGLGYLARRARKVVGGDLDVKLVEAAKAYYGDRLEVLQVNAQNLPFSDRSFDVVLLLEAIYYLSDVERFLSEVRRVLRPGGMLLICSANRERPDFNPSPFSVRYFSASELEQMLSKHGFTVELRAGYAMEVKSMRDRLFALARRIAVRYRLIPETMGGKVLLKRLMYGRLEALPAELAEDTAETVPLVPISATEPVQGYKVVYAISRVRDD